MSIFRRKKQVHELTQAVANNRDASIAVSDKINYKNKTYTTTDLNLSQSLVEFRYQAFERLISQMDLNAASKVSPEDLKREVEEFIEHFTEESQVQINFREQQHIAQEIVNDMIGLGPLEPLLKDPAITDVMVNAPDSVYIERMGKLEKTDVKFQNNKHIFQIAQRIANQVGRRIDESSPMVDARLKDGSRVNVIIPPIALDSPSVSIRRFSKKTIGFDQMVKQKNISQNMLELLKIAAKSRLNILVSGGTGAGKTTLLNALSQLIDKRERILTVEDSAELKLGQPHVIRLESRPPNIEGQGEVTIRDLVKNALRMRPDRIVVGECRSAETFDMLQAMNTGHDGSMSTLHANSSREALNRLENMILMSGHELPNAVIKSYIADAIDLIVHVARMRDGVRRITEISDIIDFQDGVIRNKLLFEFKYQGEDEDGQIHGEFQCVNDSPSFSHKIDFFNLSSELNKALSKQ
ncbi:MAG: CpaF family protein [Pseudomonadota bacterium]